MQTNATVTPGRVVVCVALIPLARIGPQATLATHEVRYMIQAALKLSRVIDAVNDRIGRWSMWLILAMTLLSAGNAVIRKAFDYSSNALLEAQWYMFSAVFLLCAGHALLHNEHIRIDLLSSRYDPRTRAWMELLGTLVFLFPVVGLVLWLGVPYFLNSLRAGDVSANPGGLILWPAKMLLPLGFALLWLQGLSQAIKQIGFLCGASPDPTHKGEEISAEQALIDELRRREQAEAAAMQKGAQHG